MQGVMRQVRRYDRLEAARFLRRWSGIEAVRKCGVVAHDGQLVDLGVSDGNGSIRGVTRCCNVHACPTCTAKIRTGRAEEILAAGLEHRRRGGELMFLTLTVPHHQGDRLDLMWTTITKAWGRMVGTRRWTKEIAGYLGGSIGYVRVLEATNGANGWHPHLHVLLFVDQLPGQYLNVVEALIHDMWARYVERDGWDRPTLANGVDLQAVESAGAMSQYLAKLSDHGDVSMELSRGDLKTARVEGNRTPFQILRDAREAELSVDRETGEVLPVADLRLWWEWERSSRGRRFMTWSRGLKESLGVEEAADEALAEASTGHQTVVMVTAQAWRAACDSGVGASVLHAVEHGDRCRINDLLRPLVDHEPVIEWRGLPSPVPI